MIIVSARKFRLKMQDYLDGADVVLIENRSVLKGVYRAVGTLEKVENWIEIYNKLKNERIP